MKYPIEFVMCSIVTFQFLYFAYISWFRPNIYMDIVHKRKKKIQNKIHSIPQWFFSLFFYNENFQLNIWQARILSLLAIIIGIIGMLATFGLINSYSPH